VTAKILTLDIETLPAIVETFGLFPNYIPIDNVITPGRVLCFAAKWYGERSTMFHAAWDDNDAKAYEKMAGAAWDLFDQADIIVGWNSTRFDIQHLNAVFGRLELGPPSPFRSLDLMQVAKRNFKSGEMSMKLDWFSRQWLGDTKLKHSGMKLWQDIRRGEKAEKLKARKTMERYNIKDVKLTEQLFDRFLPWTGINFALYDEADDGAETCIKCSSDNLHKRGFFYTTISKYQRFRCLDCGAWSRGRKMIYTTELRPV